MSLNHDTDVADSGKRKKSKKPEDLNASNLAELEINVAADNDDVAVANDDVPVKDEKDAPVQNQEEAVVDVEQSDQLDNTKNEPNTMKRKPLEISLKRAGQKI